MGEVELGALLGFDQLVGPALVLLLLAALAAGFVDAVVGGGGLIQLPALLLAPGVGALEALGTNKIAGVAGTTTSAITYWRRLTPDPVTIGVMGVAALGGGILGAWAATRLPTDVFLPLILIALVVAAVMTMVKKDAGTVSSPRGTSRARYALTALAGLGIGAYDGMVGPGTGTFLVLALVAVTGLSFLDASATAKSVNVITNVAALIVFIPHGAVLWGPGLLMALANMLGSWIGARTAIARGSGFVRVVFLLVVVILIASLGLDLLRG